MARIRILELPMQMVGEFTRTPFAIVIDQVTTDDDPTHIWADDRVAQLHVNADITQDDADTFAKTIGAEGAIVTHATLDVEM